MHIDKARHLNIFAELGKMKNEDSRGLKICYRGRNYVPKFQDILHRSKHTKRQRNKRFQHRMSLSCTQRTEWRARHLETYKGA